MTFLTDLAERFRAGAMNYTDLTALYCAAIPDEVDRRRFAISENSPVSSIDAAVKLIGYALPGWAWSVSRDPAARHAGALLNKWGDYSVAGEGLTAPAALCVALLLALAEIERRPDQAPANTELS